MMKRLILAATLALGACNNNSSGVMREIERADVEAASAVQQSVEALSTAVDEQPQTLPSGLELLFLRRGADQTLAQPTLDANVLVHYEGSFVESGEVFDSSFARGEPAEFPLRAVVAGFSEAITHMRPGDDVIATFPGSLGYGAEGRPPRIPPNAALRFRIVLLAYQAPDGTVIEARP